jgi:hypothetical protein
MHPWLDTQGPTSPWPSQSLDAPSSSGCLSSMKSGPKEARLPPAPSPNSWWRGLMPLGAEEGGGAGDAAQRQQGPGLRGRRPVSKAALPSWHPPGGTRIASVSGRLTPSMLWVPPLWASPSPVKRVDRHAPPGGRRLVRAVERHSPLIQPVKVPDRGCARPWAASIAAAAGAGALCKDCGDRLCCCRLGGRRVRRVWRSRPRQPPRCNSGATIRRSGRRLSHGDAGPGCSAAVGAANGRGSRVAGGRRGRNGYCQVTGPQHLPERTLHGEPHLRQQPRGRGVVAVVEASCDVSMVTGTACGSDAGRGWRVGGGLPPVPVAGALCLEDLAGLGGGGMRGNSNRRS